MSYQPMPTEPPRRTGAALTWLGVLIVLVGLGGAAVAYVSGQQRFDDRVKALASESGALSGCVTDLTFTKTGTFVLYYLSDGRVRVNGANDGCADSDSLDLSAASGIPPMEVALRDDNGDEIKLSRTSLDAGHILSSGGVKAVPYRQVSIRSTGDYQIEVTAADDVDRFAIGLGPRIEEPSLLVPILAAAVGIALGLLLIIFGAVQRSSAARQPTGTAVGYGYPAPPGFQAPGQYPSQPPVVYQPPTPQGFDHPTQSMPPIVSSPEPVFGQPSYGQPPYGQPPYGQPPSSQPSYGQPSYGQPPSQPPAGPTTEESSGWTAPRQPLPPPAAPAPPPRPHDQDAESDDR